MRYLIISVSLTLLAIWLGMSVARANPYLGNPLDWDDNPANGVNLLLQQNLIAGDPVHICTEQYPLSNQAATSAWNGVLDDYVPSFVAFESLPYCNGYEDAKITNEFFAALCPSGAHACVNKPEGTDPDWAAYDLGFAYVLPNPAIHPISSDGSFHTNRDLMHEFGHLLGMGEDRYCPSGPTIMDDSESCVSPAPTALDAERYHTLYHADPVQNVVASSPSPNTVNLSWSQIIAGTSYEIPNEKSFTIKRGDCAGSPVFVKTVDKNDTSETLTSQPAGTYTYCVFSDSDADNQPVSDRSWWASNPVTVSDGAPSAPSWVKSDFTSTSTNKISWASVSGAHHYYVCSDLAPNGSFSACTYRTSTYFNAGVPTGAGNDGVQWYNKVKACNSSDVCSPLTVDYTLTEAAWFSGWWYVFTSWRNDSNIDTRFINFSWVDMKWYIKNGSSTSSPNVDSTSYFAPNAISSWEATPRTAFTNGSAGRRIEGTRARNANGYAGSVRWGYVNSP